MLKRLYPLQRLQHVLNGKPHLRFFIHRLVNLVRPGIFLAQIQHFYLERPLTPFFIQIAPDIDDWLLLIDKPSKGLGRRCQRNRLITDQIGYRWAVDGFVGALPIKLGPERELNVILERCRSISAKRKDGSFGLLGRSVIGKPRTPAKGPYMQSRPWPKQKFVACRDITRSED